MSQFKARAAQGLGIVGTLACIIAFIHTPSFPTPDKLIVFLFFVFLIFHQAAQMLKRLLPFVVLILVYESFRSLADKLNDHVNYSLAPHADRLLFGNLPTIYLQRWLWKGHTSWYDVILYIPYLLFFIIPIGLAILVWKTRDKEYWRVVGTYMLTFAAAFVTFLLFPAAPPWLASQQGYIPHLVRVSSYVWASMGIQNFPSLYNHLAANPVAAVPSLHSACATLFSLFVFKLYGRRWGTLSLIYPLLIYIGVVYEGEHYAFDVIAGIAYAFAAYYAAPYVFRWLEKQAGRLRRAYSSSTKNVLKSAR